MPSTTRNRTAEKARTITLLGSAALAAADHAQARPRVGDDLVSLVPTGWQIRETDPNRRNRVLDAHGYAKREVVGEGVHISVFTRDPATVEPTAHLLKAAPAMLAALKALEPYARAALAIGDTHPTLIARVGHGADRADLTREALEAVGAAIAEAEGRS